MLLRRCASLLLALAALGGARSTHVEASPCKPKQLHVSLTGNPTEMRVSWKTEGASCPTAVTSGPVAALAQNPMDPALLRTHHGRQRSYSAADTCAAPARELRWGTTYLHTAVLTGLTPGERYFYQVEGGAPMEFSAPVPTGPTHSFTFLVYGDMGESDHREAKSPGASRTVELLQREHDRGAELFFHVGDISYANGREEIWDTFMESIEPFARHTPYMVGVGNHEYDYEGGHGGSPDPSGERRAYSPPWGNFGNDSGGECGVQISNRFAMPDVADYGYWSRNLSAAAAEAAEAAAGGSGGGRSNGGRRRNPTLGPDAGAFLEGVRRQAEAAAEQRGGVGLPRRSLQVDAPAERQRQQRLGGGGGGAVQGGNGAAARPNPPFWYSFSYGSVHFVMVSTEHSLEPGSVQYQWLELDLQRVDRCSTPWVVLGMHRPMYVVYPHKSNRIVGEHLREQLEGLLNEYQVDLVLSGHVHSYSRTCNVFDERCVPADEGGMTHIIVGCAGHKLTDIVYDQEAWLEYAAVRFGYGRVTVDSGYSLLFELVGSDGEVHDSVKLHNSRANIRGCAYGSEGEAQLAAAAAQAAGRGGACRDAAGCAPSLHLPGGSGAGSAQE